MALLDVSKSSKPASAKQVSLFTASANGARRATSWLEDRLAKAAHAKKGELWSEQVSMTPEMAEWLLLNANEGNRKLRESRVQEFVQIIKSGQWKMTSQGISIGRSGRLLNGQHRLHAIVVSGQPMPLYVTFGDSDDAFLVFDTHGVRTASDALAVMGYSHTNVLAAMARIVMAGESGHRAVPKMTNAEVAAIVQSRDDWHIGISRGEQLYKKVRSGSHSAMSAAAYLIQKHTKHPAKFNQFWNALVTGEGVPPKSVVLPLRDMMLARSYPKTSGGGVAMTLPAALIVTAWNLYVRGRTTRALKWEAPTPFPTVE